jgi:hypothetical protein
MPARKPGRRGRPDEHQLTLPLAWFTEEEFAHALRLRGAFTIRQVRFKPNRTRMISLSGDRRSLNIHNCFRVATHEVLDAVAAFVRQPSHSADYRAAIRVMRAWWDETAHLEEHRGPLADLRRACCATQDQRDFLRRTYERLNRTRFGGRLPADLTIRLSNRMRRRFGHVYYANARGGERTIEEIALNVDLMMEGNESHLLDTLLHEMSHVEAWLVHGHREHGEDWRRIAERVGCEAKACSYVRIRRRRGASTPVTRVPRLPLSVVSTIPLPAAAKEGAVGKASTRKRTARKRKRRGATK